jgi:hypothetical protein
MTWENNAFVRFHGSKYEDDSLLGYGTVQSHRSTVISLKMKVVHTSEMTVYFYNTTQRNIQEGCNLHDVFLHVA